MFSVRAQIVPLALLGLLSVGQASGFELEEVAQLAKKRAEQPYQPLPEAPRFMRNLSFEDYQGIRFKSGDSLWREGGSRFQVMMFPAGNVYTHSVKLNEIDQSGVRPIPFSKDRFSYPSEALNKRIPADLGYAGFKLAFPMHTDETYNQFLVFGGASYFRGVGRHNNFGLSARGIAIDTGLASGEEFPSFVEFWLERPAAGADRMRVFGLLDGPSLTGAYQFDIHPGDHTRIDVTAQLFFREGVELLGLAPITSMFYYGENTLQPRGEWRPQVHDSDGLLVLDGATGEWLWRPLINPRELNMSYLQTGDLAGFGLMQRDTGFDEFQDAEARYDTRPSAWIKPKESWGPGEVVLVEIPTRAETYDNIVAFWRPSEAMDDGEHRTVEYSLTFGGADISGQANGRARKTFVGEGDRIGGGSVEGAFRIIVDFDGGTLDKLPADAAVVSAVSAGEGAEVLEHFVEYNEPGKAWRLSMLVKPEPDAPMQLRGYLSLDDRPLTETWTYNLPPGTDVRQVME